MNILKLLDSVYQIIVTVWNIPRWFSYLKGDTVISVIQAESDSERNYNRFNPLKVQSNLFLFFEKLVSVCFIFDVEMFLFQECHVSYSDRFIQWIYFYIIK